MAGFSASDAAFTGFRIVWERPWLAPIWATLQFVVQLGVNVFVAYSAGSAFTKLSQLSLTAGQTEQAELVGLLRQIAPTYAMLLIVVLVQYAVLYAAINRAVFHPEQSLFGYLRLAADELRQLGLFVLFAMLGFAIYLGILVIGSVIFVILGLVTGGAGPTPIIVAFAIIFPLIICAFIFFGVRFSLASPLTYVTQRVDLFGSWNLTKGRFWPLLGAYAIAFALSVVVALLIFAIAAIVSILAGGGAAAMTTDMNTVGGVLTPARLIYLAITSIGQALIWPITISPPAAIYRALAPSLAGRTFD